MSVDKKKTTSKRRNAGAGTYECEGRRYPVNKNYPNADLANDAPTNKKILHLQGCFVVVDIKKPIPEERRFADEHGLWRLNPVFLTVDQTWDHLPLRYTERGGGTSEEYLNALRQMGLRAIVCGRRRLYYLPAVLRVVKGYKAWLESEEGQRVTAAADLAEAKHAATCAANAKSRHKPKAKQAEDQTDTTAAPKVTVVPGQPQVEVETGVQMQRLDRRVATPFPATPVLISAKTDIQASEVAAGSNVSSDGVLKTLIETMMANLTPEGRQRVQAVLQHSAPAAVTTDTAAPQKPADTWAADQGTAIQ